MYRAITEPVLMAGCPRNYTILNGTLAGAVAMGFENPVTGACVAIPLGLCGWALGRWLTKQDPRWFAKMNIRSPDHMRP